MIFERLVVGVDGGAGGADALALAAALQRAGGGELVAVYAYPFDRSVPLDDDEAETRLQRDMVARLEREIARLGLKARAVVAADASPARALGREAERARATAIVVGSDRRARPYRLLPGRVAASLLRDAPCAVAVAPRGYADGAHELRHIRVGYDGGEESRGALAFARALADGAGARLRATFVVPAPLPTWGTDGYAAWTDADAIARRAGHRLAPEARGALAGVNCDTLVGDPADELVSVAAASDLLVLGSRGYGPVRRLVLGSTSTRVLDGAACPVLVLPRAAAADLAHSA